MPFEGDMFLSDITNTSKLIYVCQIERVCVPQDHSWLSSLSVCLLTSKSPTRQYPSARRVRMCHFGS